MNKIIQPKKRIVNLEPYTAVRSFNLMKDLHKEIFKLDWNEATIPPSRHVFASFKKFLSQKHHLNWYPDPECLMLRKELARYTGRNEEEILVTNGSDAALELIARTYLDETSEVVAPQPAYGHFTVFAKSCDAIIKDVYFKNPFVKEVDTIIKAITDKTRMVYLINPNNPTGVLYTLDEIIRILKKAKNAIVIVDEAYYEYTMRSATPLLNDYPNLIVTRSFSKAFGLAGVRIGYLITNKDNIPALTKLHNIKSVNTLAQVAALAALEDTDYLYSYLDAVKKSKSILEKEFRQRNITCIINPSNFALIKVKNPEWVQNELAKKGVFVRDRSKIKQLEGYLRFNIGTPNQMKKVMKIFWSVIK